MSAITEVSRRCHPSCLVCGSSRTDGLALHFQQETDGSVVAEFDCGATFQGYPDRLHGGVVAMLLDAAMTHCLFSRKVAGLTTKLSIRYHRAVMLGVPALVRAELVDAQAPLYYLESRVIQDGHMCATAKGVFWDSARGDLVRDASAEAAESSRACFRSATIQPRKELLFPLSRRNADARSATARPETELGTGMMPVQ
ncbi:MAG: PaaI family thioesterase [Phycisphaerae bacterium]